MTDGDGVIIEELIRLASQGDDAARQQLLNHHQARLKKMVAVRMDPRLSARFDGSDVVQDALMNASRKLDRYLKEQPLPFYPWLRQIAWECLVHLHERHIDAQKRSITREGCPAMMLSDQSVHQLADLLAPSGSSPSRQFVRKERRRIVREALQRLRESDREVLVLRFLEELSVREVATMQSINEGAVQMRQLRALERLRDILGNQWEDS